MRRVRFGGMALGLLVIVGFAKADTVVGSPSFFSGGVVPNEGGTTFWDNQSIDGSQRNIGYFLRGAGGFSGGPQYTTGLSWAGATFSTVLQGMTFARNGIPELVTVLGNFSGNGLDFGIYDASSATPAATMISLLTATGSAAGTSVTFTSPYATYGFYTRYLVQVGNTLAPSNGDLYFSETSKSSGTEIANTPVTGVSVANPHQHFALFAAGNGSNPQSYILGIEDGWGVLGLEKTGDFQDLVVQISSIPEPATFGLIGIGLSLLAFASRRRRQ